MNIIRNFKVVKALIAEGYPKLLACFYIFTWDLTVEDILEESLDQEFDDYMYEMLHALANVIFIESSKNENERILRISDQNLQYMKFIYSWNSYYQLDIPFDYWVKYAYVGVQILRDMIETGYWQFESRIDYKQMRKRYVNKKVYLIEEKGYTFLQQEQI